MKTSKEWVSLNLPGKQSKQEDMAKSYAYRRARRRVREYLIRYTFYKRIRAKNLLKESAADNVRANNDIEEELVFLAKFDKSPIVDGLKDRRPEVRIMALHVLGQLGDPSVLPMVRDLTRDRERKVARTAARIISLLENPQNNPGE